MKKVPRQIALLAVSYSTVALFFLMPCFVWAEDGKEDLVLKEFVAENILSLDKEQEIRNVSPESVPKTKKCRLRGKITAWIVDYHYLFSDGSGEMRVFIEDDEYRNNRDAIGRYFEISGTVKELKLTGEYGFVVSKIRPTSNDPQEKSSSKWSTLKRTEKPAENKKEEQ